MTSITINLPDSIGIARAGTSVTVDVTKIPAEIWARLAEHGLIQKVGDAAAGSKVNAAEANMPEISYARGVMLKVYDQLAQGTWGASRGSAETDEQRAEKYVAAGAIRAQHKDDKAKLKAFNELEGDALAKRLATAIETLRAKPDYDFAGKVAARVTAVIDARKKREAEKAESEAATRGLGDVEL